MNNLPVQIVFDVTSLLMKTGSSGLGSASAAPSRRSFTSAAPSRHKVKVSQSAGCLPAIMRDASLPEKKVRATLGEPTRVISVLLSTTVRYCSSSLRVDGWLANPPSLVGPSIMACMHSIDTPYSQIQNTAKTCWPVHCMRDVSSSDVSTDSSARVLARPALDALARHGR